MAFTHELTLHKVDKILREGRWTRAQHFLRHYAAARLLDHESPMLLQQTDTNLLMAHDDGGGVNVNNVLAFDFEADTLIPRVDALDAVFHAHHNGLTTIAGITKLRLMPLQYDREVLGHLMAKLGGVPVAQAFWNFARNTVRTLELQQVGTDKILIRGDRPGGAVMSESPTLMFTAHERKDKQMVFINAQVLNDAV